MSGLSAMDTKASGRLGVLTITYYLWTTFIAVIVGIILVLIIHPGTGSEKDNHHASSGPVMTSADALLDLIRSDLYTDFIIFCSFPSLWSHSSVLFSVFTYFLCKTIARKSFILKNYPDLDKKSLFGVITSVAKCYAKL